MESLEDSNCQSMSDSFSLYERYMRSFNIGDSRVESHGDREASESASSSNSDSDSSNSRGNIDLSTTQRNIVLKHDLSESHCNLDRGVSDIIIDTFVKVDYSCTSPAASLLDNSSATNEHSRTTDKSDQIDVQVSSEETKRESFKQPIFITSTMENSNNAVDSVPMFRSVRNNESIFKLPIRELSFNGTLKHVQKLKPIVDPISALSSNNLNFDDKSVDRIDQVEPQPSSSDTVDLLEQKSLDQKYSDISEGTSAYEAVEKTSESTGDSQYEGFNVKKDCPVNGDASTSKWNLDQSHSSFEASFDSGVRSPDMFSDNGEEDRELQPETEPFWSFLKDFETYDKRKVRKMEETLQGILPPPSVTILKTDVTTMLKKYYNHLPLFNENCKLDISEEANSTTPTKRVSFIEIPDIATDSDNICSKPSTSTDRSKSSLSKDESNTLKQELDTSASDKTIDLKLCSEIEAVETAWPDLLKCRHYDVYYNVTKYSEKFELLSLKFGERFVGAETDTSVNIYSGGFQSPSSASKRKAIRLKMAQAKSPGRRLSHLARRRQAFCSAATINEKALTSTSKMVLIDKKKLINSAERKSPRVRRTPGKKTPTRKTPGKKTPAKTPKTRSGGSSRKKAMRRLLMDSESMTRSQPSRETLKRALFISPENRKSIPPAPCTSVPVQALKTKRALFGSPERPAETKSSDGSISDNFLKRKLDAFDDRAGSSRSKIAKSLSFGGDTIGSAKSILFSRRASEVIPKKSELNDNHKQKLLWAVSEALRVHGWRMSSPGFREKASTLARLTRKLMTLPPHAAKLATPNLSTSDTLLKIARLYVFAIIQGRTVEECYQEEQMKISNDVHSKVSGYISANAYQQIRNRQNSISSLTSTSQIKENTFNNISSKFEQSKSGTKNVLQDKLVNIDTNSNSSGMSSLDKASLGLFKSNSMPSFEEAAKMRARRQISFDNVDFPKR